MQKTFPSVSFRLSCLIMLPVLVAAMFSGCASKPGGAPGSNAPSSTSSGGVSPENAKAVKGYMNSGNTKAKARQWDAAAGDFRQALALDPRNVQALVQLGWVYAESGQWDQAKEPLLKAVALNPENPGAHANLAWVYAEKHRWPEAQQSAKKAIDLNPKNAYAHATLAWAYQATGQDALAMAEYEKSLELDPALDNSRLALGISYCNQGMGDRAKEQLGQLQKRQSSRAAALQERLKKGCSPRK